MAAILHRHSVISAEQRLFLQGLAGLRNVLAHLCSDVDYGRLIDSLSLLGRVEDLAKAMLKYVEERGLDPLSGSRGSNRLRRVTHHYGLGPFN